jgi:hypothetical protein
MSHAIYVLTVEEDVPKAPPKYLSARSTLEGAMHDASQHYWDRYFNRVGSHGAKPAPLKWDAPSHLAEDGWFGPWTARAWVLANDEDKIGHPVYQVKRDWVRE